jgi:glutamyl/glutaminyl-tRNA synthetase
VAFCATKPSQNIARCHFLLSCFGTTAAYMITRLAPTPSGFLHQGNLYNFLLNWLWARANGGRVLLRIDDADASRKRAVYVEDIFVVLEWLGLDWDMGPAGPDDFEQHWSQLRRHHLYTALLDELAEKKLLFACTCSRSELAHTGNVHDCTCAGKQLPLSTAGAAWRILPGAGATSSFIDTALGAVSVDIATEAGSFVVRQKDGAAAYQTASLADDRHFGITHICRGADLLPCTAMQLYLDAQLHKPLFHQCRFWHHPLLTTDDGAKLSKSAGQYGQSITHSTTPQILLASFAAWMGWGEYKAITLEALVGLMREYHGL